MFENTFQARLLDVGNISKSPSMLISKPVFKIGRHPASDFVIEQKTISGRHAVIEQKQNGYFIVDQNSTNKTRVNGTVLDPNIPKQINDGDEIQFDKFSFIFKLEKIEPPPSGPAQDDDETIFFDSSSLIDDINGFQSSQTEPSVDETFFSEKSPILPEQETAEPPPSAPAQDYDETIFFDSSSLIDDIKNLEPSQPAEDNEGTIFLDSGSLADEVEEAGLSKKPADTIEKTKIGNYEVIKLLGKGGFGSVWEARTKDGQPIAIKVLNPDVLENERAVRKFFHEAIILSRLDHPNICRFIDFFPYEENYAIVMDFVQGTELKTILENQKGPLPFDTALRIASQTLDAFHYAHMQNVLHRDIKPENITLDTEGTVKVMDFGIAKLSSSESQQTSLFMISPAYTAPERFDAEKTEMVDHRSDIYSLGLVFYEIFTGTHPFPTTNPVEMIVAHINKVPSPPDEITDLPPEISAAILKALEKNPKDRFEDFAAFKISLLGEPPRMPDGRSQSAVSFYGEYCKGVAVLLKMYADILKKYEKKVDKISMVQEGTQVHLIIEPRGGNPMRITKDLATIIKQ
ncbi:MAG: protein kinase [Desulfobacterales bacterium]|uniref:Protein kinase n=1 Tax=Candidatus Desulfatibia profunda TaxID=2841695 RepID=A0A8J6TGD5_9BACT|nr:protein kinase [Candidatus Desulfatibia profunda]MBL7179586.1 protein kinase [Desulfobacterales bacterium]